MWLHSQSLLTLPIYFPLFVTHLFRLLQPFLPYGRSPGLVAMGGDSCFKGCEFESQHGILDEHFCTYLFAVKFVMFVWKDENKWGQGCSFKNTFLPSLSLSLCIPLSLSVPAILFIFIPLSPSSVLIWFFRSSISLFCVTKKLVNFGFKGKASETIPGEPFSTFFPSKAESQKLNLNVRIKILVISPTSANFVLA